MWRCRNVSSLIGATDALNMDVERFACAMRETGGRAVCLLHGWKSRQTGKAGGPDASALRTWTPNKDVGRVSRDRRSISGWPGATRR